jgi:hydrogenase expression/formation protein HypC
MCLAVPMKVLTIDKDTAVAEVDGVKREASLMMLSDEVQVGDYVLIHAGFAISKLDEEEAKETIALMRECLEEFGMRTL